MVVFWLGPYRGMAKESPAGFLKVVEATVEADWVDVPPVYQALCFLNGAATCVTSSRAPWPNLALLKPTFSKTPFGQCVSREYCLFRRNRGE